MLRMLLISVIRVGIVRQGFAGGSREQSARKILAQGIPPCADSCLTTTMCQKPIVRQAIVDGAEENTQWLPSKRMMTISRGSRKEKAAFFQSHHRIVLYSMTLT
ncbi:unnamed protein product [Musa hybrid cultivar]